MTEEIMALCRAMGATEDQEGLLLPLAGRDRLCLSGGAGMMEREWRSLLAMYGQEVTLRLEGMEDRPLRAFLQPVLDREREQRLPSPLGQRPEDRYLYLGPADIPLEAGRSQVEWKDRAFEVQSAHLVGDSHWWALLRPRDREAT